jgi:hypothetical protein
LYLPTLKKGTIGEAKLYVIQGVQLRRKLYNIENEEIVLPAISVHLTDKMQRYVVSTQVLHGSHLFVSQSSSLSVVIHFTAESFNEGGGGMYSTRFICKFAWPGVQGSISGTGKAFFL